MTSSDYLVTGACGMIGSHIMELLAARNCSYKGTFHNPQTDLGPTPRNYIACDVRDYASVYNLVRKNMPRVIFHLAAQSYPTVSWQRPQETVETNINGTVNLFEAIRHLRRQASDYDPVVVVACSSAQYGLSMTEDKVPLSEDTPMLPLHPYGVSKVAQDLLSFQYHHSDGIRAIRARIFNTTGPRKQNDVISDWAQRIVQIERGEAETLRVGNLKARRAIMDVNDLIEALFLLAEHGEPGEAYNICHDHLVSMEELLTMFRKLAETEFEHEIDPSLLRAADEAVIYGDSSKLKQRTGWRPRVTLEETVERVLDYERSVGFETPYPQTVAAM